MLRIEAQMLVPDRFGGIAVREYAVRVKRHSDPDLAIANDAGTPQYESELLKVGSSQSVQAGGRATYYIRGRNKGSDSIALRLTISIHGSGRDKTAWSVRLFSGTQDVTAQVRSAAGLETSLLAPGAMTEEYRLVVSSNHEVSNLETLGVTMTAASSVDADRKDWVMALTSAESQERAPIKVGPEEFQIDPLQRTAVSRTRGETSAGGTVMDDREKETIDRVEVLIGQLANNLREARSSTSLTDFGTSLARARARFREARRVWNDVERRLARGIASRRRRLKGH